MVAAGSPSTSPMRKPCGSTAVKQAASAWPGFQPSAAAQSSASATSAGVIGRMVKGAAIATRSPLARQRKAAGRRRASTGGQARLRRPYSLVGPGQALVAFQPDAGLARYPAAKMTAAPESTEGARDAVGSGRTLVYASRRKPKVLRPTGLDASRHRGVSKRSCRKSASPSASRARCFLGLLREGPRQPGVSWPLRHALPGGGQALEPFGF